MDAYQGSVYDPVSLHKYLYCSANPVMFVDPSGYMAEDVMVANGCLAILSANLNAFVTSLFGLLKTLVLPAIAAAATVVALLPVIKYVATHEQTNNYSESVRDTVIENATGNTSAAEASAASRASSSRSSSSSAASVAGGSGTATPPTPNDPNNRNNNKNNQQKDPQKEINRMNQEIQNNPRLRSQIDRVDPPHNGSNGKAHIHFKDGKVMDIDGGLSHSKNGIPKLTGPIKDFLSSHGWPTTVIIK
jgi:hypothetical protein